jgi:hypothetical protein
MLSVIMLCVANRVILLNVVMLCAPYKHIMLSVVMLNVVMLIVVAPFKQPHCGDDSYTEEREREREKNVCV